MDGEEGRRVRRERKASREDSCFSVSYLEKEYLEDVGSELAIQKWDRGLIYMEIEFLNLI